MEMVYTKITFLQQSGGVAIVIDVNIDCNITAPSYSMVDGISKLVLLLADFLWKPVKDYTAFRLELAGRILHYGAICNVVNIQKLL